MDTLFEEDDEYYFLRHGQQVQTNPLGRVENGKSADIDHVRSPCKLLTCFLIIESSAGTAYSLREGDQLVMVIDCVHHSFLH